jgi:hypothetical protein
VFGRIKKNRLKVPFPTFEIFRARTSATDSDLNQQSLKISNFPACRRFTNDAGKQFRIFNWEWRADLVSSGSLAANM